MLTGQTQKNGWVQKKDDAALLISASKMAGPVRQDVFASSSIFIYSLRLLMCCCHKECYDTQPGTVQHTALPQRLLHSNVAQYLCNHKKNKVWKIN